MWCQPHFNARHPQPSLSMTRPDLRVTVPTSTTHIVIISGVFVRMRGVITRLILCSPSYPRRTCISSHITHYENKPRFQKPYPAHRPVRNDPDCPACTDADEFRESETKTPTTRLQSRRNKSVPGPEGKSNGIRAGSFPEEAKMAINGRNLNMK